jgi:hypothetical protein
MGEEIDSKGGQFMAIRRATANQQCALETLK